MSKNKYRNIPSFRQIKAALAAVAALIGLLTVQPWKAEQEPVLSDPPAIEEVKHAASYPFSLSEVPGWNGDAAYCIVNDNTPFFTKEEVSGLTQERYARLDDLGRCGQAVALISRETMPTEERGSIGQIKPSGWHTVRYDDLIEDRYLYNRCHLIGYQLTGQNANDRNLITGTRYLNISGMLPFENDVAEYVRHSGNHVLYRVTPMFDGDNLICSGILMEALSVEDHGDGIQFCVYCYNVQPSIEIDYVTGESRIA